ncbi:MAG: 4Fe-4S dicluster domain-containing protein [Methanosarcinales archaeon]|nr:4Fe-4S dicluster domain-containing protein [Methanosarcinales archaeon]
MIPHAPIGEPGSSLANKTGSWRIFIPVFSAELCNGCGTCETFCPEGVVHKRTDSDTFIADYDYCKGCGICAYECPKDAIKMILEEK